MSLFPISTTSRKKVKSRKKTQSTFSHLLTVHTSRPPIPNLLAVGPAPPLSCTGYDPHLDFWLFSLPSFVGYSLLSPGPPMPGFFSPGEGVPAQTPSKPGRKVKVAGGDPEWRMENSNYSILKLITNSNVLKMQKANMPASLHTWLSHGSLGSPACCSGSACGGLLAICPSPHLSPESLSQLPDGLRPPQV